MIQATLQIICLSAAFLTMPILALVSSTIARAVTTVYLDQLSGKPLPALTQFWIVGVAQHSLFVPVVFIIAALLLAVALVVQRKATLWKTTGLLVLSTIGFTFSFFLGGVTCVSALLPFIGTIVSMSQ